MNSIISNFFVGEFMVTVFTKSDILGFGPIDLQVSNLHKFTYEDILIELEQKLGEALEKVEIRNKIGNGMCRTYTKNLKVDEINLELLGVEFSEEE